LILRANENRFEFIAVKVRFVCGNFGNFGNESARPTFEMNEKVEGIGNIGLGGPVRKIYTALQHATCKTTEDLSGTVGMNRGWNTGQNWSAGSKISTLADSIFSTEFKQNGMFRITKKAAAFQWFTHLRAPAKG